eukprot:COSAG06_NODE_15413_length_1072_cov_1.159301_1_plen_273_part_10
MWLVSTFADVWSFGVALYVFCVRAPLFRSNAEDDIVDLSDLHTLAYSWDTVKMDFISRIQWPEARDLVLWCLQGQPERRPQSFADVLRHQFFGGNDKLRFLSSPADTLTAATAKNAITLHVAIEKDKPDTVRQLLDNGGVHYNLCLQGDHLTDAQRSITPLHRAARYGRLQILRILLEEIHPQALAAVINATTQYDHTALHWSSVYDHAEAAAELIERGCDTTTLNYRGKTAWDVAEACGSKAVCATFERLSSSETALTQEKEKRARRPEVTD